MTDLKPGKLYQIIWNMEPDLIVPIGIGMFIKTILHPSVEEADEFWFLVKDKPTIYVRTFLNNLIFQEIKYGTTI